MTLDFPSNSGRDSLQIIFEPDTPSLVSTMNVEHRYLPDLGFAGYHTTVRTSPLELAQAEQLKRLISAWRTHRTPFTCELTCGAFRFALSISNKPAVLIVPPFGGVLQFSTPEHYSSVDCKLVIDETCVNPAYHALERFCSTPLDGLAP